MWSLHCSQGWVVWTILQLHFDEGIPFSGICANQSLVNEDWLALGNMKLDIQHTVRPVEGISQVWNGVATDNDICHTLQIHYSYHSKIKSVFWN